METSVEDINGMIEMCLNSIRQQKQKAVEPSMKAYLDGYEDALKTLKDMIEMRRNIN